MKSYDIKNSSNHTCLFYVLFGKLFCYHAICAKQQLVLYFDGEPFTTTHSTRLKPGRFSVLKKESNSISVCTLRELPKERKKKKQLGAHMM